MCTFLRRNACSSRKEDYSPLKVKVENAIAALLPHGEVHLDAIAAQLGMSTRTLVRQLASEGHSFTKILEDLRLALARRYLAESEMSISEIAWLLGYSEVANFTHAFHRWTGTNPRTERAKARRSIEYSASKSSLNEIAPLVNKKVRGSHRLVALTQHALAVGQCPLLGVKRDIPCNKRHVRQ